MSVPLSVDALADELLAALRDHPDIRMDPAKGEADRRLCAAYNRLYCELHDKEPPPLHALPATESAQADQDRNEDWIHSPERVESAQAEGERRG